MLTSACMYVYHLTFCRTTGGCPICESLGSRYKIAVAGRNEKEIKEEADRLVNLHKDSAPTTDYDFQIRGAKDYDFNAIKCAIIDLSNTIEALENHTWQNQKIIKFQEQVKQELESRL